MALKIGVFVKHVPDTNSKIELKDGNIDRSNMKYVLNPYDEFAVEEAVKTKEAWMKEGKEVEIVGISLGSKAATKSLRDSFAIGVDRGVLILDEDFEATDPLSVSRALAGICQDEQFHLIFAGKQSADTDSHAVAQMVAEFVGIPHIGVVSKVEWESSEFAIVERDVDGGAKDTYKVKLPALFTANKGLNKMRLASLPNIRRAGQKPLKEVPYESVQPGYKITGWKLPSERGAVKMIEGSPAEQAAELIRVLREEAKVI